MPSALAVFSRLPPNMRSVFMMCSFSTSAMDRPARFGGPAGTISVEAWSDGRVRLSTGTLYGAIKRLLDDGWIRRVDDPEPGESRRERKAYALTERGRRVLSAEIERLRTLVQAAHIQTAGETA